jgi:hypothetical protein
VFPWLNRTTGELVTAESFIAPESCRHLYQHFLANGRILGIACPDGTQLAHTGRDVRRLILEGDEGWRDLVPRVAWAMALRHARLERS